MSVGAQYATGEEWRNNTRKNEQTEPKRKQRPVVDVTEQTEPKRKQRPVVDVTEQTEPKRKQRPVVDVTGDESKVQCGKEQYCIGTWNVRSMNQGKLEVVKHEMARVNINILGIS